MVVCFSRSRLMVNDETPISYLPDETPGMIAPNGAGLNEALRPSVAATALNRSMSTPMTVFPSLSRNSLGGYVASVPTVIVPSSETAEGTFDARAASRTAAVVRLGDPPGDAESLEVLDPPQAASTKASAVTVPVRRR